MENEMRKKMSVKLSTILVLSSVVGLSACLSEEQIEQNRIDYQTRHYAGKGTSGNPQYWQKVTAGPVSGQGFLKLLPQTIESVRQIPVSELPKPTIENGAREGRDFQRWCQRDGFDRYKIVRSKHDGAFVVTTGVNYARSYSPEYEVTAECVS